MRPYVHQAAIVIKNLLFIHWYERKAKKRRKKDFVKMMNQRIV